MEPPARPRGAALEPLRGAAQDAGSTVLSSTVLSSSVPAPVLSSSVLRFGASYRAYTLPTLYTRAM